jgi:diguanylate cyclase (GGDEF)-like protein
MTRSVVKDPAPFDAERLAGRAAPFLVVMLVGFALYPAPPRGSDVVHLALAGGITMLIVGAVALLPWRRLPRHLQLVPPLMYFVVVAILRDAEGGATSALSTLAILPIFWLALYGTPRELAAAILCLAAAFSTPIVVLSPEMYPATEWERVVLWVSAASVVGFTVQRLVRQVRAQAMRLEEAVRTDDLTGVQSRGSWEEALPRELARARRADRPLCLAMIDLDNLRAINDAYGHQAGSHALKEAASAWRGVLRAGDFLARYGGDEFALILVDTGLEEAVEVAERLRTAMPAPFSCCVGVARWDGSESDREFVNRADAALYEAKRTGRDRCVAASAELRIARPVESPVSQSL